MSKLKQYLYLNTYNKLYDVYPFNGISHEHAKLIGDINEILSANKDQRKQIDNLLARCVKAEMELKEKTKLADKLLETNKALEFQLRQSLLS